jgi:hypothetical protein
MPLSRARRFELYPTDLRAGTGTWVLLILTTSVGLLSPAHLRADLRFSSTAVHAGVVRAGTPLAHQFTFVNDGPEPVELIDARPSCGCLRPTVSKRVYKPGEEGRLKLEVNTLNQAAGPHNWTVRLQYKSGEANYEVGLQLSAKIITEVLVQPAAMVVIADKATSHEITLTDLRRQPLAITDVTASSPKLVPQLSEQYRDIQGHWFRKISLQVAEDYPDGRHDEVVEIHSSDPSYPSLRVPVTIVRRSQQHLTLTPSQVTISAPAGQPFPSRIVLLRSNDDKAVVIGQIESDDPAISCQWATGPNNLATLKIHIDRSQLHANNFHSSVTVHVSKPVDEKIVIPIDCKDQ